MNSKLKGIIICGVLIASLGAAMVILDKTKTDSNSNSSDTSDIVNSIIQDEATLPLMSVEKSSIKHIKINNKYGEINFNRIASTTDLTDAEWEIEELKDINTISTYISATANISCSLTAKVLVEENASDFKKYGLDELDTTTVVITTDTGEKTFLIGNESTEEGYSYVREKGSSKVYTVLSSNLTYYRSAKEFFVNTAIVPEPSDDAFPVLERLTITRKDIDYDMVFVTAKESDSPVSMISAQVMISPIYQYLNVTRSADVTHGIWGLTASEAVVVNPTDEDFAKYGLSDPFASVILDSSAEDYTLKIGNPIYAKDDNGKDTTVVSGYYAYINAKGANVIYILSAEECVWATVVPGDIISGLMTYNYIIDVSEIISVKDGVTNTFSLNSYDTDSDGAKDKTDIKLNSKAIDEEEFKLFYQFIMGCPTTETYFEPITDEKLYMSLTIKLNNGKSQVINFYTSTDRRLIVELDGLVSYKIPTSYAERFISNIQALSEGNKIVTAY